MSTFKFDIGIVGGGVSGLHLALCFAQDEFFENHSIVLFEKEPKTENDKTWSFWENGEGKWDKLIHKQWSKGKIFALNKEVDLNIKPFTYKTLRSIDFYTYAYQLLQNSKNIKIVFESVVQLEEDALGVKIKTKNSEYHTDLAFNSQLPDLKKIKKEAQFTLLQHFKGWFIESNEASFNPNEFIMMDYRYKDGDKTSFVYVLPFSEKKALIEYTYFTPDLVEDSHYDYFLNSYISDTLKLKNFKINEQEKGIIPMSNYNFSKNHTARIIQIGTAGGWVKASSGYSFKNAEKKATKIAENLKNNLHANHELFHPKYKHYDAIFLDVLYKDNQLGEEVFYKLYAKNKIQTLLQFLDDDTTYLQDLSIIKSLSSARFIKAFFNHLFQNK